MRTLAFVTLRWPYVGMAVVSLRWLSWAYVAAAAAVAVTGARAASAAVLAVVVAVGLVLTGVVARGVRIDSYKI